MSLPHLVVGPGQHQVPSFYTPQHPLRYYQSFWNDIQEIVHTLSRLLFAKEWVDDTTALGTDTAQHRRYMRSTCAVVGLPLPMPRSTLKSSIGVGE